MAAPKPDITLSIGVDCIEQLNELELTAIIYVCQKALHLAHKKRSGKISKVVNGGEIECSVEFPK